MENLTAFKAVCLPSMSHGNEDQALMVVAARFDMPVPGVDSSGPLMISSIQYDIPLADEYHGEPGSSSLKWEGQAICARPGTDIHVRGHACAPRGTLVKKMGVSIAVGPCERSALVFGDRRWQSGVATEPVPFQQIPLVYERCFGGSITSPSQSTQTAVSRNPVGCGIYENPENQALPNIENPQDLISDADHKPHPQGFGPVARNWLPRRQYAGTYDQHWIEHRAPLWPDDIDPRFFVAAAPGLVATPHLVGGESVSLVGVHPDGALNFQLPAPRLRAKFTMIDGVVFRIPILDAVCLEPDALALTLIYRASVPVKPDFLALQEASLRLMEHWEPALAT